ncbi:hypothetical protein QE390_001412 [Siphonobacter sp. SORGH_AS 1065]|nr:hypothetical protein [Siphonobacter sp. SORGH_AS_1065]
MNIIKAYKYQIVLYLMILLFGIQNYYFSESNFSYSYYENIVYCFFIASVVLVFLSIGILISEVLTTFERESVVGKEVIYLIINILLYYSLMGTSLYLSTQIR